MNAENLQHLHYELTMNDQTQSIKLILRANLSLKILC